MAAVQTETWCYLFTLHSISSARLQYLVSPNFAIFVFLHHNTENSDRRVPAKSGISIANTNAAIDHVSKTRNAIGASYVPAITRNYIITPLALRVGVQYLVSPVRCRVLGRPDECCCDFESKQLTFVFLKRFRFCYLCIWLRLLYSWIMFSRPKVWNY